MKKIIVFICFFWALCFAQAQEFNPSVSISANFEEGETYLEFMFSIKGNSLTYIKNSNDLYTATVSTTVDISLNGKLYKTQQFNYTSRAFRDDSPNNKLDIIALEDIFVPNGKYQVSVKMQDVNMQQHNSSYSESIVVDIIETELAVSNISFFSFFSKNSSGNTLEKYGYYFTPLYQNHLPANLSKLPYWFEVYNSEMSCGPGKHIFFNTYIENYENGLLALPAVQKLITFQSKPKILCYDEIDLSNLPTGRFYMMIQIIDNNNCIIGEIRKFFTNENPYVKFSIEKYDMGNGPDSFAGTMDHETLKKYILMLDPISSQFESDFFKNNIDTCSLTQLQNYFYSFWYLRNKENPEQAWKEFLNKR